MKMIFGRNEQRQLPSDRASGRVQAVLVIMSVLLFGLFYLVGFDFPYDEDPRFNAPLLTDAVLWFSYALLVAAFVVSMISVIHGIRMHAGDDRLSNGIPAMRIAWCIGVLLASSLLITFLFGSSEPLIVNGRRFTSAFWLKLTDMFINTSIVLGVIAVAAVGYGMSGLNRRLGGHNKKKV